MSKPNMIFFIPTVYIVFLLPFLAYGTSLQACTITVVNNSAESHAVKILLNGPGELAIDCGELHPHGGIVEKKLIGPRAALCVDTIWVDERIPEIFEVPIEYYQMLKKLTRADRILDLNKYFAENKSQFIPLSSKKCQCIDRQFDIIGPVERSLLIITRMVF